MLCQPVGFQSVQLPSGEYLVSGDGFQHIGQKVLPVFACTWHEDGIWVPFLYQRPTVNMNYRSLLLARDFIVGLQVLCRQTRFVRACLRRWQKWARDRQNWRRAVDSCRQKLLCVCFHAWREEVLTRKALSRLLTRRQRQKLQVVAVLRSRASRRKKSLMFYRSRLLQGAWSAMCTVSLQKQKSGLLFSYTRLQLETLLLAHFLDLPEYRSSAKGRLLLGLLTRVHQEPLRCLVNPSAAYISLWSRLEVVGKGLKSVIDQWLKVTDTPVSHHLQYLNRKYRGDWHLRIQQKYQDVDLSPDVMVILVLIHVKVSVLKLQSLMALYHQTISPSDPRYRDTVFFRDLQRRQHQITENPADLQLSMLGWQQRHPLYSRLQTFQLVPLVLCSLLKSRVVES